MIRSYIYSFILLVVSTLLMPQHGTAEPSSPQVVLLSSPSSGNCATAFFLDEFHLVTNAHVAAQLCSGNDCSGTDVYSPTAKLELGQLTLNKNLAAFDIAVLRAKVPLPAIRPVQFRAPVLNEEVTSLGHPRCGPQQISKGKVLGLDSLHLLSSTKSMHGSSGSPIIAADGAIVGIVDEAASVYDGVRSILAGSSFNSRGIRADVYTTLSTLEGQALLDFSVAALNSYYLSDVAHKQGLDRIRASMQFLAMLEGLRISLVESPETSDAALRTLGALKAYPLVALRLPSSILLSKFDAEVERLVVAANIELKGPRRDVLRSLDESEIRSLANNNGRSSAQQETLLQLFNQALSIGYQGLELSIAVIVTIVSVLGIILLLMWACVFGYCLSYLKDHLVLRIGKSLLLAITFPISIFFLRKQR
jgi:hypothetical protein